MSQSCVRVISGTGIGFLISVCVAVCSTSGAEQLRVALTGDELLVEAVALRGRANSAAGIYAVDQDGNVSLVVPRGGAPVWSPDRRRFAFWRIDRDSVDHRRYVFVADRTSREVRRGSFSFGMRWQRVPTPGVRGIVTRPIHWMPNGKRLLLSAPCISGELGWNSLLAPGEPLGASMPSFPLVPAVTGTVQGRVAVRPDGAVAFERLRSAAGLGYTSRDVAVLAPGADEPVRVSIPGLPDNAVVLNPHWRPGGQELSVDVMGPKGERQVVLVDPSDPAAEPQPIPPPPLEGRRYAMFAWSPDGRAAMLCSWGVHKGGPFVLYWPDVRDSPEGEQLLLLGGATAMQACFSPDSRRVALLDQDASGGHGPPRFTTLIVRASLRREGPARGVFMPKGLTAMSIAW